jgi:Exopolyphosphatase
MGIEKVIGVGGGIRGLLGRYEKMSATHDEFELLRRDIIEMDKDERKAFFKIPTDRAELIHHSAYIYSNILRQTGINKISAIPWGLTEAIAYSQVNDTTRK